MACIGVLALQGDFSKHIEMLRSLGCEALEVRQLKDLKLCDGLIIPGGESTVMLKQLDFFQLRQPVLEFAHQKPVFGTCAGLILLSKRVQSQSLPTLNLIDVEVERNAFGRQVESFQAWIPLQLQPDHIVDCPAFFIRAPRIRKWGEEVQVLASWEGEPILVKQGHFLGATFHPELTGCALVHQYFVDMVKLSSSSR
jgi:5'-phosphate synthase pdxT subunit